MILQDPLRSQARILRGLTVGGGRSDLFIPGTSISPNWTLFSIPSANGTVTRQSDRLSIQLNTAPYQGGMVLSVALATSGFVCGMECQNQDVAVKVLLISPTLTTTTNPLTLANHYRVQEYGTAASAIAKNVAGVGTTLSSNTSESSLADFIITIDNAGNIRLTGPGVAAREPYALPAGPVYTYFFASSDGAALPAESLIGQFFATTGLVST